MTRSEFERSCCELKAITLDEFRQTFVALPCDCGNGCEGWACIRLGNDASAVIDQLMMCMPKREALDRMWRAETGV